MPESNRTGVLTGDVSYRPVRMLPCAIRAVIRALALLVSLELLCTGAVGQAAPLTGELQELRVGTPGDYAPFSFRVRSKLAGFDITLARRLAKDLHRRLRFVTFRWPELIPDLRAGKFDIAMGGVTMRGDRALFAAFSRPYASTGAVAIVRARDLERYHNMATLNRAETRIGVNAGGHLEAVARQHFPQAQILTNSDNRRLPHMLETQAVDAVVSEAFEGHRWAHRELVALAPFTHDHKTFAIPLASVELANEVNTWLAAREADGWLNRERRRWLGEQAVRSASEACVDPLAAQIGLRLQMMPYVAAAKQREQLPINDPKQEAKVLEHVRTRAVQLGLEADAVAELFAVQFVAAKAIQEHTGTVILPSEASLADVRQSLGQINDQLLSLLAGCRKTLTGGTAQHQTEVQLHQVLDQNAVPRYLWPRFTSAARQASRRR